MRSLVAGYFCGQFLTFVHLTGAMQAAPEFDIAQWPQVSLYNLLVANFWPIYWPARLLDPVMLEYVYWTTYAVARSRVTGLLLLFQFISG